MTYDEEEEFSDKTVYIATLINPVDHKPYAVTWSPKAKKVFVVSPPAFAPFQGKVVGEGYFDDDEDSEYGDSIRTTGCPRSHTPGGVTKKGAGLGLMLYSGLALTAAYGASITKSKREALNLPTDHPEACISSSSSGRSAKATGWWEAQAGRGFAKRHSGESVEDCDSDSYDIEIDADSLGIDEESVAREAEHRHDEHSEIRILDFSVSGSVEVQYEFCGYKEGNDTFTLAAQKVLDSGMVIDVNKAIEDNYEITMPRAEVLREIDLEGVKDWGFIDMVEKAFEYGGGTPEDYRVFLSKRVDPFLSRHDEKEGRIAGPFRGYARNPVKHGKAWLELYGDLIKIEEEVGKAKENPDIDKYELRIGIETEMEHTSDREVAKKIALDHLREHPKYYTKLRSVGLNPKNEKRVKKLPDGLTCPRCKSTDTRQATNYGRPVPNRMNCLACNMLWTVERATK